MPQKTFPIEEVARYPSPGNIAPGAFAFSPDDSVLTFLYSPNQTLSRQLFKFDLNTGERRLFFDASTGTTEENVSPEEALRRERQRQLNTGVTHYEWSRKENRVLIPLPDGLYMHDGSDAPLRKIVDGGDHPILDPRFSPDGKWVSFVQDAELYIVSVEGGEPRQLTHGARGTGKTNGLAEFVAQEEMRRFSGYWWSPDSTQLAFEAVDETHIPIYRIVHQGKDAVGESAQEDHRYPFAGQPNAKVRLGVVSIDGNEPAWMDLGNAEYLCRVQWLPNGKLSAQLMDREQSLLDLILFNLETGSSKTLLTETSKIWVNLHNMLRGLPEQKTSYPNGFIWASERSGYQHLYLYDAKGSLVRQLTSGEWVVEDIVGVDSKKGFVYFTGRKDSPLESHLYVVSFEGGEVRRITRDAGMHNVVLDHKLKYFVEVHNSFDKPPHVTVRRLSNGGKVREITFNEDPRVKEFSLRPPEMISFTNRAGVTLYGALYRPSKGSNKPLTTLVDVYGGPQVQKVTNSWQMTVSMRVQYLRNLGYAVFVLDNRGSANRGLAFEGVIKHNMGDVEVQDQVDGVRWLIEQGITDPARVGVYGSSYGGYMAAMCLGRAPDTFKLAVVGAPVSSWDGYDTFYTEQYMGLPQSNAEGYKVSSVLQHVETMQGKLMLVHGLIDENVHFRHTARLIYALICHRKRYDLLLFPDERHSPRKLEDRVFMEEQIRNFFVENL